MTKRLTGIDIICGTSLRLGNAVTEIKRQSTTVIVLLNLNTRCVFVCRRGLITDVNIISVLLSRTVLIAGADLRGADRIQSQQAVVHRFQIFDRNLVHLAQRRNKPLPLLGTARRQVMAIADSVPGVGMPVKERPVMRIFLTRKIFNRRSAGAEVRHSRSIRQAAPLQLGGRLLQVDSQPGGAVGISDYPDRRFALHYTAVAAHIRIQDVADRTAGITKRAFAAFPAVSGLTAAIFVFAAAGVSASARNIRVRTAGCAVKLIFRLTL